MHLSKHVCTVKEYLYMKFKQDNKNHRFLIPTFTLIELLVVITIISILAALLLPALARAKYQAKNVLCIGQLRQISMAWTSYASDFDGYWPDFGVPRPDTLYYTDGARGKSMILAVQNPVNGEGSYDLRPTLRSYMGANLNDMMVCPLASPKWHRPQDGWRGNEPGGNKYYDIDNYGLGEIGIVQSSYQLFPTGHSGSKFHLTSKQMRKVGNPFVSKKNNNATAGDLETHVIASDLLLRNTGTETVLSTQRPYKPAVKQGGGYFNNNTAWELPSGVSTFANFATDDCSVSTYSNVGYYSYFDESFLTTGSKSKLSFYIPADLAQ